MAPIKDSEVQIPAFVQVMLVYGANKRDSEVQIPAFVYVILVYDADKRGDSEVQIPAGFRVCHAGIRRR